MRKPFLIEMLMVIVIFACVSTIELNLFVKAYQFRKQAEGLNYGDLKIQTIVEYIKGSSSEEELENQLMKLGIVADGDSQEWVYRIDGHPYKIQINQQPTPRKKGLFNIYQLQLEDIGDNHQQVLTSLAVHKYFREE